MRLLKELCRRHQAANPNLSCFVTSYLARPELKIRDRRGMVTSLSYTKAIQQLSHHLTHSFLLDLYQFAKTNLPEAEIVERFLVLTPDLLLGSPAADPQPMSVDDSNTNQAPAMVSVASANLTPSVTTAPPNQATALSGPTAEITYASLAALPPSTSGSASFMFQSPLSTPQVLSQVAAASSLQSQTATPVPVPATLSQFSTTSPTYATLTPVQFSPTNTLSGSFLSSAPGSGLEAASGDESSLVQRQRHRFAQKSTPYPQPT
jgi:hypothetical protein